MANKTTQTEADVLAFIASVPSERKREDSLALVALMREMAGEEPRMWGPTMIGFGKYRYAYKSGRTGENFLVGFSPRKANLTVYINGGLERHAGLLEKLGKHTTGNVCLYIKKLADVDMAVLRELVAQSVDWSKADAK